MLDKNILYCELVQNIVSQIDVVDSCAVVPKPDKETLFKSKAYVVLKPEVEANKKTEEHIIRESMNIIFEQPNGDKVTLKPYEAPASVTFMDELPRTDSAEKIDYGLLQKMAEEECYTTNNL